MGAGGGSDGQEELIRSADGAELYSVPLTRVCRCTHRHADTQTRRHTDTCQTEFHSWIMTEHDSKCLILCGCLTPSVILAGQRANTQTYSLTDKKRWFLYAVMATGSNQKKKVSCNHSVCVCFHTNMCECVFVCVSVRLHTCASRSPDSISLAN